MVSEGIRRFLLEDILNEKQVHHVVKQATGADTWALKRCDVRAATDGLAGFVGDHIRASLHVSIDGELNHIPLFIKCIPMNNKPKAEYIDNNNYFKREKFMFQVLEEIRDDNDPDPWCPKAYIYTDSMIVMPDLAVEGYASCHYLRTLDHQHEMTAATMLARYHAGFTNYETNKSIALGRTYNTQQQYGGILTEPNFCDSPFTTAAAKLTANFIKAYSCKSYRNLPDLEEKIAKQFLVACDTLKEYKGTLNVMIHKDLWVNNIMFKYDGDVIANALLVDYQVVRYAPPAFDLMTLMYLTTSRSFRESHEKEICDKYFTVFCDNLNDDSKQRMRDLGYNKESFLRWCELGRMFAVLQPNVIFPFILMHPKAAQTTFDDPATYERYVNEDRSEPVIAYAQQCDTYRERLLEIAEEFVETYVLKQSL